MPGANVTAHNCKIQEKDEDFYRQFHLIICGLDSIVARRWINGMLISLLEYSEEGTFRCLLLHLIYINSKCLFSSIFLYINVADQQLYLFSIGELDRTTIKPMIDGGTEGFKGKLFS